MSDYCFMQRFPHLQIICPESCSAKHFHKSNKVCLNCDSKLKVRCIFCQQFTDNYGKRHLNHVCQLPDYRLVYKATCCHLKLVHDRTRRENRVRVDHQLATEITEDSWVRIIDCETNLVLLRLTAPEVKFIEQAVDEVTSVSETTSIGEVSNKRSAPPADWVDQLELVAIQAFTNQAGLANRLIVRANQPIPFNQLPLLKSKLQFRLIFLNQALTRTLKPEEINLVRNQLWLEITLPDEQAGQVSIVVLHQDQQLPGEVNFTYL